MGTFGRVEIAVPRARLDSAAGKTTEWKSSALRAYQRRTKQADSLIAAPISPEPIRVGCGGHSRPSLVARSAKIR